MYQRLGNPAGANGGPRSAGRVASNLVHPSPGGEGLTRHRNPVSSITHNSKTIYELAIGVSCHRSLAVP